MFNKVGSFGTAAQGAIVGGMSREVVQALEGYVATKRNADAMHTMRVNEAARLYANVISGKEDPIFLREAMTPRNPVLVTYLMNKYPRLYPGTGGGRQMDLRETMSVTDYQALFVDVLDRMYYGYYNTYPIVNKGLVRVHQLRDFRTVKRYMLDGVVAPLTKMDAAAPYPQRNLYGPAPQQGAVPATAATPTGATEYEPALYQAGAAVNWRAIVNDDLGIFRDLSTRLSASGNQGISKFITELYVDSAGPNADLYNSGYANQIITANGASSSNPPLSSQGIMDAFKILAGMRDSTGNPILITGKVRLWFGPALVATAENLMNSLTLNVSTEGGTQNADGFPTQWLQVNNWLTRRMEPVMDPYIPIVCTTSGVQDTMWGITVDPDSQNRPNSEVGFLAGWETPQILQKAPNTQRMGGGLDSMLGDFYTMDQELKIVTVFGGTQIDGRSTVASTGQGS